MKVKVSVRLLPSTISLLRTVTEKQGFGNQISLYVEQVLNTKIKDVRAWKVVQGRFPDDVREKRVTLTLKLHEQIFHDYGLEAYRLRIARRTDLIEIVLLIAMSKVVINARLKAQSQALVEPHQAVLRIDRLESKRDPKKAVGDEATVTTAALTSSTRSSKGVEKELLSSKAASISKRTPQSARR